MDQYEKAEIVLEAMARPRVVCHQVVGMGSFINCEAVLYSAAAGEVLERAVGYDETGARECLATKIQVTRPDQPYWPDVVRGPWAER